VLSKLKEYTICLGSAAVIIFFEYGLLAACSSYSIVRNEKSHASSTIWAVLAYDGAVVAYAPTRRKAQLLKRSFALASKHS
jgi:hypothetical protein